MAYSKSESGLRSEIPSYSSLSDSETGQDGIAPRDLSILDIGKRVVASVAVVIAAGAVLDGCGGMDDGNDSPEIGTLRSAMTIEESFAAENFIPAPVINDSGVNIRGCKISYDQTRINWNELVSFSPIENYVKEGGIEANSDGTVSILEPVATLDLDSSVLHAGPVDNADGTVFRKDGSLFLRNGEVIGSGSGGAFNLYGIYRDDVNPAGCVSMGRARGFTADTVDVAIFPADYSGPPLPITSISDLRSIVTVIPELSPDPPDFNEALVQSAAIFTPEHAYITEECNRGVSTCIVTPDAETSDIYMYNFNPITGLWDTSSKIKIASTDAGDEGAICVLDTPNAECLFIDKSENPLYYACHLKDSDGDTVVNFDDNCVSIPNPDQSDVDSDGIGDVCDEPVITPDIGVDAPLDAGTPDSPPLLDSDGDGVHDGIDNCLFISNPSQEDSDSDWFGNLCDNCPVVANSFQEDSNGNGIGDACEPIIPDAGVDVSPDAPSSDAPLPDVSIPDSEVPDAGTIDAPVQPDVITPPDAGVDAAIEEKHQDSAIPEDTQSSSDTQPSADSEIPKDPPPGCSCNTSGKPNDDLSLQALALAASTVIISRKRRKS